MLSSCYIKFLRTLCCEDVVHGVAMQMTCSCTTCSCPWCSNADDVVLLQEVVDVVSRGCCLFAMQMLTCLCRPRSSSRRCVARMLSSRETHLHKHGHVVKHMGTDDLYRQGSSLGTRTTCLELLCLIHSPGGGSGDAQLFGTMWRQWRRGLSR